MKSKLSCIVLAIGLLVVGFMIILGYVGLRVLNQRQEQSKSNYLPPEIQIISPVNGTDVPAGSYLTVLSTMSFTPDNPVKAVEWWLDGNLLESHSIKPGNNANKADDYYSLLIVTEGTHLIMARAINTRGVIGTSLPLTIQSTAKGDAYYDIPLKEGETLENLASDRETDVATLQNLNPDLDDTPAAGTLVKVPVPKKEEASSPLPVMPPSTGLTLVTMAPVMQIANSSPAGIFDLFASTPPVAPTNLKGEVKDCKVKLAWEDNAANENGYEIWMAASGTPLRRMVMLKPSSGGLNWFEFQAPGPGYFLFWVEAVNAVGKSGSNIIYLNIDTGCPAGVPTHLKVEVRDITVNGNADRVYCYISSDNAPEERLPLQNGQFININNGHGDMAAWPHSFALSIPKTNSINISGECWGWAGQNLNKLGTFSANIISESWDGKPIKLQGGTFEVSLSIQPEGMDSTRSTYANNGGILEPYNLRLEYVEDPDWPACDQACWVLRWDFDISPNESINWNFDIYWKDQKTEQRHYLRRNLPGYSKALVIASGGNESLAQSIGCDENIQFYVEAQEWPEKQITAGMLQYKLPLCPAHLSVKFDAIDLPWTGDGLNAGPCDEIDVYYSLMVNDQKKDFWGGCSFGTGCFLMPLKCGFYTFKELAPDYDPYPDVFSVDVFSEEVNLKISTKFFDFDTGSGDDDFANHEQFHTWKNHAEAQAELGCKGKSYATEMYVNETADSILHYTISIYPCNEKKP